MLVGLVLGLLGGGGSLLVVAIIYLLEHPENPGTAYITFLVGVASVIGVIPRIQSRQVDWSSYFALGIPVSVGMLLARGWLTGLIPEVLIDAPFEITKKMLVLLLVAFLLLLSFATMVGLIGKNIRSRSNLRTDEPVKYYSLLMISGLLIGILPGLSGAGGGVLIVPLLVIFFGIDMKTVVGTSLAIITTKSFVGFFGGDLPRIQSDPAVAIDWTFLGLFSIVMVVGALLGIQISKYVDSKKLKSIFAWFLLGLSIFIIVNELIL